MTEREAWAEYIAGPDWTGKPTDIWRKAIEFEREACAKVCENFTVVPETQHYTATLCAAEIRMRSNATELTGRGGEAPEGPR